MENIQPPAYVINLKLGHAAADMKRAIALGDRFNVYVCAGGFFFKVSSAIAHQFDENQLIEASRRLT